MSTIVEEVPPPPDLTSFIVKSSNQYSNGGSFGDVYRCWYDCGTEPPIEVAVKAFRLRLENPTSSGSHKMIRRELGIWRRLNHKNIVPFLGITYGFGMQGATSLVSLWMINDTLLMFLEKHDHELNVAHRLQLLLDIANGLDYLHSFPIVHGDLSCNNVLLGADYTARLADFGYASLVGNIPEALACLEMSTTRPGALRWAAPEQVNPSLGFKMTTKSDIYSFGSISLQEGSIDIKSVLSGKKPWSEVEKDIHLIFRTAQGHNPSRPETPEIDDCHWDFIQRCWLSVQERPSATEVVACIQQFLNSYPQPLSLRDLFAMSHPQLEGTLHITDITLNVLEQSGKTVDQIRIQTGGRTLMIPVNLSPGNVHREVFNDALGLSVRDFMNISLKYRVRFGERATISIPVALSEVIAQARDKNGRKIYLKFYKGIEVTIGISNFSAPSGGSSNAPPQSTTSEIPDICSRFQVLAIGINGVGKSTLIRKAFGDVDISGISDIDKEFIAQENGLYDSPGLESGESDEFDKIKDFIKRWREMAESKGRLYAVWVCLAIPHAGGRLFEAGMEEFLSRRKEILGNIPIVVVLTKLDLLDMMLRMDIWDTITGDSEKEKVVLQKRRDAFLLEHCINPLLRAGGNDIPWVAISAEAWRGLESTIPELVTKTISEIKRRAKTDPSYADTSDWSSFERDALVHAVGMAFGRNIEDMTNLTLALGKKKYWKNFSASLTFSAERVKEYLLVIHEDIIRIWNFNDPEMALRNDAFKAALLDPYDRGVHDTKGVLGPVTSAIKRFMAYIVDIVYVMKLLFVLAWRRSVTSQDVSLALQCYEKPAYRNRIHLEIRDFNVGAKVFPGGRDSVMEKVEVLIGRFEIDDREVVELRSRI